MSFQSRHHLAERVAQGGVAQVSCYRLRTVYCGFALRKHLATVLERCTADLPCQASCYRLRTVYSESALPPPQVPRGTVDSS